MTCDLAGQSLLYPDGYISTIKSIGAEGQKSSGDHPAYGNTNLGLDGIVAWRVTKAGVTSWWGTKAGLRAYWDAYGKKKNWP